MYITLEWIIFSTLQMKATCNNILNQYKPINKYLDKLDLYPDVYTLPHTPEKHTITQTNLST